MPSTNSGRQRPGSRSSIRSRNLPPLARAWAWPSTAEKAWPRCSRPEGDGAKRVTFRTHSMIKATAATLDGDSPLVVSCHRHLGLASGVADGKTGFRPPVSRQGPASLASGGIVRQGRRRGVRRLGRTLERFAPCIIPTSFAIRTVAPRWCSTPTIRRSAIIRCRCGRGRPRSRRCSSSGSTSSPITTGKCTARRRR